MLIIRKCLPYLIYFRILEQFEHFLPFCLGFLAVQHGPHHGQGKPQIAAFFNDILNLYRKSRLVCPARKQLAGLVFTQHIQIELDPADASYEIRIACGDKQPGVFIQHIECGNVGHMPDIIQRNQNLPSQQKGPQAGLVPS